MCISSYPSCTRENLPLFNIIGAEHNYIITENCTVEDESYPPDHHNNNHDSNGFIPDENYDFSNTSFIGDIWLIADPAEIILKLSSFLPIVLWGIMGNSLLLYVLVKNRHLRSPTNLLIGNMAVADLATLLIHPWVFMIYTMFQNYQLGVFGCKIEGALEASILLCSVMNLSAISYDRLTAIVLPQETRLTRKSAKIAMVTTWIAGIAVASPLSVYRIYKERVWLDFVEKYCTENTVITNIYWHVIITMMVWMPLTIMLVCYISIFVKLSKYEKVVLRHMKTVHVRYRKKVAKTMFVIVSTFMVCRLPFTALIFYRNQLLKNQLLPLTYSVQRQVNGTYKNLWFASKILIFVNAAANPIIYGLMNEKFRRALKNISWMKWLFVYVEKKLPPVIEEKKEQQKETKETLVGSNKSKIFVIFKGNKNPSSKPVDDIVEKSKTANNK